MCPINDKLNEQTFPHIPITTFSSHTILSLLLLIKLTFNVPSPVRLLVDSDEQQEIEKPCEYGNWTQWSECEVVCQPVKKGSNKVRQRLPVNAQNNRCGLIEELYYCDPNIYC